MPPVSERQRRFMRAQAAAAPKGGRKVPQKVAREYNAADKGGKLPKRKGKR